MSTETERRQTAAGTNLGKGERKLTFVIDDDALFNGDRGERERDSSASFLELATALAQRKWFILKMTAAAGVIGAVVALLLPNWYAAETKILPPQQQQSSAAALLSSLGGAAGNLASAAGKDFGLRNPNDLYVGILKTRPIADALIGRFDLQKVYRSKDMTDARKTLADHTDIVSEKTGMISISVEEKDKKRAADMANAYVEELRRLTKGLALTEASQRRWFYEDQLKQARDDVGAAEIALKTAQHKSGVVQLDAQSKTLIEGIGDLRAHIIAKQVELQALRSFATDQNPDVDVAQRELASMQGELRKLEKQSGDPGSYEMALKDLPDAAVEYIRAARELKFRETIFELLAKQFEAAKIDEAKDAALIQVVESAIEPDRKSSPKRAVLVILSALLGCFLACLLTLMRWWKSRVNIDPKQAEQLNAFRAAVLGK